MELRARNALYSPNQGLQASLQQKYTAIPSATQSGRPSVGHPWFYSVRSADSAVQR
jgi:hypothetical protein